MRVQSLETNVQYLTAPRSSPPPSPHVLCSQGPLNIMAKAFPIHGEVFTVPVAHKRITFLIGPRVSSHFFKVRSLPSPSSRRHGASFRGHASD